jgi:flagellar basal-body rod protein FlgB
MAGDVFPEQVVQILEKSLFWQARRQEILAGNLANQDTPQYRRKDLDFRKVLQDHLQGVPEVRLAATHAAHLPGNRVATAGVVQDAGEGGDLDRDMVHLAENQLAYQASVQMLIHKLDQVRTALEGDKR